MQCKYMAVLILFFICFVVLFFFLFEAGVGLFVCLFV